MNKIKIGISVLSMVFVMTSCKSKKGIVTKKKDDKTERTSTVNKIERAPEVSKSKSNTAAVPSSTAAYIDRFSAIAMIEMRNHKIPASITLAQGILESGSGKGRLAKQANNHFGIKCHGWNGKKIYHDDDRRQECFRKYKQAESSYEDHSEFLTTRGRYSKLFDLKQSDYRAWAKGLRAAGYATDRKYPQKLISLIERYELYKYDAIVIGGKPINHKSQKSSHKVSKGDTLYSIAKKYGISVESLKTANHLNDNTISIGQILVIKN